MNGNQGLTLKDGLLMSNRHLAMESSDPRLVHPRHGRSVCHARHFVARVTESELPNLNRKRKHRKERSPVSGSRAAVPVAFKLRLISMPIPYWGNTNSIIPIKSARII